MSEGNTESDYVKRLKAFQKIADILLELPKDQRLRILKSINDVIGVS